MLLMDLKDEYRRALRIVENANFNRSSVNVLWSSLGSSLNIIDSEGQHPLF